MKNLLAIFAFFVLTGILFSCHPEPAEGNPLTIGGAQSSNSVSSSSLRLSSSYLPSSSSLLSSSAAMLCIVGTSCLPIDIEICLQNGGSLVVSCPVSSSSNLISSSSTGYSYGSFYDIRDGETYNTVEIGNQTWMTKNLNYYVDGSTCYNNQESNCEIYGRLYNWAAAWSACPEGWRLPSNATWDRLLRYLDSDSGTRSPYDSRTAGGSLKATSGWEDEGNGLDIFGFAALPGGYGISSNNFRNIGSNGYWWTASEYNSYTAYNRYMNYSYEYVNWDGYDKNYLFSVRCVQD
jgi:uncharacterized protein (TIGR02145 family)